MPICISKEQARDEQSLSAIAIARLKSRYHNGIVTRLAKIILLNSVAVSESAIYCTRVARAGCGVLQ